MNALAFRHRKLIKYDRRRLGFNNKPYSRLENFRLKAEDNDRKSAVVQRISFGQHHYFDYGKV